MDDQDSAIYGTVGYQAPEIAKTGPTVATDVYTRRAHAGRAGDGRPAGARPLRRAAPRARRPCRCSRSTSRCTARSCAPPIPIRHKVLVDRRDGRPADRSAARDRRRGRRTPRSHGCRTTSARSARSTARAETRRSTPTRVIAALPVPVVDPTDSGAALLATTSGTPPAQLEHTLTPGPRRGEPGARVPPSRSRCALSAHRSTSARHGRPGNGSPSWNR